MCFCVQLSVLLLAALLFQATVRGQDNDNFEEGVKEIYLPLIQNSQNSDKGPKDSIPVTEENNENFNKGVEEIYPPPPSGDCTCVPFYLCKNNTNILNEDGEGVIDIRFVSRGICRKCECIIKTTISCITTRAREFVIFASVNLMVIYIVRSYLENMFR